jgi:hypothetical protein
VLSSSSFRYVHGCARQGALCVTVALSVALDDPQESNSWCGGVHVTMRQATGPVQLISWWHCPYRKLLQHTRRWSHVAVPAQRHRQLTQPLLQKWPAPHPQLHRP